MDLDLPAPLTTKEVNLYGAAYWNDKNDLTPYEITYAIDGYFGTHSNKQYLHDTAAKIAYALNGKYSIEKTFSKSSYTLSRFNHLDRVPAFNTELEANAFNGSRNEIFNALRHKAYRMHKTNTLNLEALTIYGNQISNGSEHIKYLAPNVFKWVETNYTGRQSTMTRSEAAINASKIKAAKVKELIFSALNNPFFVISSHSVSSVCRKLSVHRTTFKKYLSQFEQIKKATALIQRAVTPYVRLVYTGIEDMNKVVKSVVKWMPKLSDIDIFIPITGTAPPDTIIIQPNPVHNQNKQG